MATFLSIVLGVFAVLGIMGSSTYKNLLASIVLLLFAMYLYGAFDHVLGG